MDKKFSGIKKGLALGVLSLSLMGTISACGNDAHVEGGYNDTQKADGTSKEDREKASLNAINQFMGKTYAVGQDTANDNHNKAISAVIDSLPVDKLQDVANKKITYANLFDSVPDDKIAETLKKLKNIYPNRDLISTDGLNEKEQGALWLQLIEMDRRLNSEGDAISQIERVDKTEVKSDDSSSTFNHLQADYVKANGSKGDKKILEGFSPKVVKSGDNYLLDGKTLLEALKSNAVQ